MQELSRPARSAPFQDLETTMWLINAETLELEAFYVDIPHYAILSHTWEDEEVTFQEFRDPDKTTRERLRGYEKIQDTCTQALADGYKYAWVDTCCINKESSAELSEAINSMYKWYKESSVCYAYLSDVIHLSLISDVLQMTCSRWFTRGWTLQELLAPSLLIFFAQNWKKIATKDEIAKDIKRITGIDERYIRNQRSLSDASVAERMFWASSRSTTRVEDIAYCLIGIFEVSMHLLYGEGEQAFLRLQNKIMRTLNDHTLFAWGLAKYTSRYERVDSGILAKSPIQFRHSQNLVHDTLGLEVKPPLSTNGGVSLVLPIHEVEVDGRDTLLAVLSCRTRGDTMSLVQVELEHAYDQYYFRTSRTPDAVTRDNIAASYSPRTISLLNSYTYESGPYDPYNAPSSYYLLRSIPPPVHIDTVLPLSSWNASQRLIRVSNGSNVIPPGTAFEIHILLNKQRVVPIHLSVAWNGILVPRNSLGQETLTVEAGNSRLYDENYTVEANEKIVQRLSFDSFVMTVGQWSIVNDISEAGGDKVKPIDIKMR